MIKIRDILIEALDRANIVPRRQAARGDIVETAYRELQGIVKKYNNDNFLSFTQNEAVIDVKTQNIHIYDDDDSVVSKLKFFYEGWNVNFLNGKVIDEVPEPSEELLNSDYIVIAEDFLSYRKVERQGSADGIVYTWGNYTVSTPSNRLIQLQKFILDTTNVHIKDVAKISAIHFANKSQQDISELSFVKCNFVPFTDFDNVYDCFAYTFIEKSENEWILKMKSYPTTVKMIYNESLEFDLNSELYIPDAYAELLIVALTHRLALRFPRLDSEQMERLKLDLISMQNNVKTPKADAKYIYREGYDDRLVGTYQGILRGWFL